MGALVVGVISDTNLIFMVASVSLTTFMHIYYVKWIYINECKERKKYLK